MFYNTLFDQLIGQDKLEQALLHPQVANQDTVIQTIVQMLSDRFSQVVLMGDDWGNQENRARR